MKIRVSYTTDEELAGLIQLLSPVIKSWKLPKQQKGQYKKAYLDIDLEGGEDNACLQR